MLRVSASAPPLGLRHSAPGSRPVGPMRGVRGAGGRDCLSSPQPRCAPAACSPSAERGAFLIGGHTLRGRGAASLNSSPPAPNALTRPPYHPLWLRGAVGGRVWPRTPPGAHRGRQDRRPNEAPRPPRQERGLELGWGPEPGLRRGSRDPPARARLRTAWGWGDSESRAQEGTEVKPAGQPRRVGKAPAFCSLSPLL